MAANSFLTDTKESSDLNQYWFSEKSIATIVNEVVEFLKITEKERPLSSSEVALVSAPSIYFSIPEQYRSHCIVLEIDKQWENDRGFVYYDFNEEPSASSSLEPFRDTLSFIVIDPPFITEQVWRQYAKLGDFIGRKNACKFLCTTVYENRLLMRTLFDCEPRNWRPSIPHLVYQYCCYTNYDSDPLQVYNAEIYDDKTWWKEAKEMEEKHRERDKTNALGIYDSGTEGGGDQFVKSPPIKSRGWKAYDNPVNEESGKDSTVQGA